MSLLDQAKNDYKAILDSKNDWSVDVTVTNPITAQTVTIAGHGMTHHLKFDLDKGQAVNSRQSHITLSIDSLVDAGYTLFDANNKVALYKHNVSFSGDNYYITECFPDLTLNIVTCILSVKNN